MEVMQWYSCRDCLSSRLILAMLRDEASAAEYAGGFLFLEV
jgi:hypothetical protein